MPFQLCFAEQSLPEIIDEIAADANAVAPGLGRERARSIADRIFRARVTQSSACGMYRECEAIAPLWPDAPMRRDAAQRPCAFHDSDPHDLPNVFAVAASDLLGLDGDERDSVEGRLATAFRCGLAKITFRNNRCGRAAVCHAPPTDPFDEKD
jgi:hypothetical protein